MRESVVWKILVVVIGLILNALFLAPLLLVWALMMSMYNDDSPPRWTDWAMMGVLVPAAVMALRRLRRAPACTPEAVKIGTFGPLAVAVVAFIPLPWEASVFLWLGLTIHLGWSLPWIASMDYLNEAGPLRRAVHRIVGFLSPVVLGVAVFIWLRSSLGWPRDGADLDGSGPLWFLAFVGCLFVLCIPATISSGTRRRLRQHYLDVTATPAPYER